MSARTAPPAGGPGVAALNSARARARRRRAEGLASVASGLLTAAELIECAALEDGAPLRSLRLGGLLRSQPRWGRARAGAVLESLRATLRLGPGQDPAALTVGWLLDNRTRGQRYAAFLDAAGGDRAAPWPGFPFAARPAGPAR